MLPDVRWFESEGSAKLSRQMRRVRESSRVGRVCERRAGDGSELKRAQQSLPQQIALQGQAKLSPEQVSEAAGRQVNRCGDSWNRAQIAGKLILSDAAKYVQDARVERG